MQHISTILKDKYGHLMPLQEDQEDFAMWQREQDLIHILKDTRKAGFGLYDLAEIIKETLHDDELAELKKLL